MRPPVESNEDNSMEGEDTIPDLLDEDLDDDCKQLIVMHEKLRHDRV